MTQRTWDVCNGSSLQLSIHQLGDNEVSRKGQESEITRWQEKTFKGNSYDDRHPGCDDMNTVYVNVIAWCDTIRVDVMSYVFT